MGGGGVGGGAGGDGACVGGGDGGGCVGCGGDGAMLLHVDIAVAVTWICSSYGGMVWQ